MMRGIFLLFFIYCSIGMARGQDAKERLETDFINSLHKKNIDTICTYQNYFIGGIRRIEKGKCAFDPTYVLWKEKGKTFLTKIDTCFNYQTINVKADSIWSTYFENKQRIKEEKVLPFQYSKNASVMVDHSGHQRFKIYTGAEIIDQLFDEFDLQKESIGRLNINFEHNNALMAKKLMDALSVLVETNSKEISEIKSTK